MSVPPSNDQANRGFLSLFADGEGASIFEVILLVYALLATAALSALIFKVNKLSSSKFTRVPSQLDLSTKKASSTSDFQLGFGQASLSRVEGRDDKQRFQSMGLTPDKKLDNDQKAVIQMTQKEQV